MVLGTIKRAKIIAKILVPVLNTLNFLKGISLFARYSIFGFTITEIITLINAEKTISINSTINSLNSIIGICLKLFAIPIYTKNTNREIIKLDKNIFDIVNISSI